MASTACVVRAMPGPTRFGGDGKDAIFGGGGNDLIGLTLPSGSNDPASDIFAPERGDDVVWGEGGDDS